MNASVHLRRFALGQSAPLRRQRVGSAAQSQQRRWTSSVMTLSDGDAVKKFRAANSKSVMYFTATWCPPCKVISPVYAELSAKYADVAFGKVDVDDNPDAAGEFRIQAVPTFIFSKGAEEVNKFSGADRGQLEKLLQDHQDS
eukprot:CAMPEP_0172531794 /NCGR_PEP_ID=MMETSP1067-20121228/5053_1 /TAXON_ID=265564 ORGANISM="Thalassiosira punctigera, Strain Tpunct2005C2" /NCGR_SAMPLE_ID=MMETSP1067 /ASSEMBLY_ACC=CAM_ASM_000444 /LENGTH=141 /DNA_ID=CAMNT_0013316217 /DNA_START=48 /DNA_END=473 /DNA_ORIENTATION=+